MADLALYCTIEGNSAKVFPIRYEDKPEEVWTTDPSIFPHEPGHEKSFPIQRLAASRTPVDAAGSRDFSFSPEEFSDNSISSVVHSGIEDLGNRYTPKLNVRLDIAKCFDGLARNHAFRELSSLHFDEFFSIKEGDVISVTI